MVKETQRTNRTVFMDNKILICGDTKMEFAAVYIRLKCVKAKKGKPGILHRAFLFYKVELNYLVIMIFDRYLFEASNDWIKYIPLFRKSTLVV